MPLQLTLSNGNICSHPGAHRLYRSRSGPADRNYPDHRRVRESGECAPPRPVRAHPRDDGIRQGCAAGAAARRRAKLQGRRQVAVVGPDSGSDAFAKCKPVSAPANCGLSPGRLKPGSASSSEGTSKVAEGSPGQSPARLGRHACG